MVSSGFRCCLTHPHFTLTFPVIFLAAQVRDESNATQRLFLVLYLHFYTNRLHEHICTQHQINQALRTLNIEDLRALPTACTR